MPDDAITPEQRALLRRFAARVAGSPHNLVSRSARSELLDRHVPESIGVADRIPGGVERVLDVGSGGGFPGMVIAIVRPELDVHLLDSTAKKTRFLAEVAEELGQEVTVHTGRAERLGRGELASSFDVVTARAVAPLDRLLAWTVPFLRPGGLLLAVKGERWHAELEAVRPHLPTLGARLVATPAEPPAQGQPRVLVFATTAAQDTEKGRRSMR